VVNVLLCERLVNPLQGFEYIENVAKALADP